MRTTTSRVSSLVLLLLLTVNVVYSCVDVLFVLDPTTEVSRHRATKVASELSKRDGLRSSVVVRRPNGHYVFMMTKKAGDLITTLDTLDGDYDHYLTMVTSEIMRRRHARPLVILLFSETAVNSSLSSTWKQFSRDKKVHVFRVGTAKPSNELSADEGESFEEILSCSAITKPLGDVRRRPAISEVEQSSTTVRPRTLPFSKTTRRPTTTRPVTTTGPKLHPVFHHKVPSQEEMAAQDLPSDASSAFSEKNNAPVKVLSKRPSHGGGFDIAQQQHLTIDATNRVRPTTTGSTPRRHSLTPTTPFAYPTKRHTISPLPSNFASTHLPQFSSVPDKNTAETAGIFHHSTSSIHIPNPTAVPSLLAPTQVAPAAFRDILPSPDAFDKRLEPGLEVRAPEATHPSPHAPVILHNRELVLASSPVPQSSSLGQEFLPDVNDLDHDEITTVIPHSAPAFRPFPHVIPTSTSAAIIVHDSLPPSTTAEPPVETSSHFDHVDITGTHLATTHASSRDPTPTTPYIPPPQGTTPQVFPIHTFPTHTNPTFHILPTSLPTKVTTPTIPTPASFPIRLASLPHSLPHILPSRTTPTPRIFSFKTTSFSRSPTSTTPFRPAVVHTTLRVSSSPRFTATPRRFSPFTARAQQGFAPAFNQRFSTTTRPATTRRTTTGPTTTTAKTPPGCVADIIFAMDFSDGTGDKSRHYLDIAAAAVGKLPISANAVRVALVRYSGPGRAETLFHLDKHSNKDDVIEEMFRMESTGGTTRTGEAIQHAAKEFGNKKHGARKNARKFIVVFTDGYSQEDPTAAAEAARAEGITILSVSVEDDRLHPNLEELVLITGRKDMILISPNGQQLRDKILGNQCHL